jgi:hypothetical protein
LQFLFLVRSVGQITASQKSYSPKRFMTSFLTGLTLIQIYKICAAKLYDLSGSVCLGYNLSTRITAETISKKDGKTFSDVRSESWDVYNGDPVQIQLFEI